jgi:dihydroorotate dehydrogenase
MKSTILASIGLEKNKKALLAPLQKLPQDQFKIFATNKTSQFLNKNDVPNQLVHKISQSKQSPNIAQLLIKDKFDLIINIPTRSGHKTQDKEFTDGQYIRQKAVENNTTLITDIEVAKLWLESSLKDLDLQQSQPKRKSPQGNPFTPFYHPLYDINKSYDFNYEFGPFFSGPKPKFDYSAQEEFLGFNLNSKFGIPAGPLLNGNWIKTYADLGFDLLTYKTIRTVNQACHQPPNIVFIDPKNYNYDPDKPAYTKKVNKHDYPNFSITNSFGVPSKEPDVWQEDIKRILPQLNPGQLLILSVMGSADKETTEEEYIDDYVKCAQLGVEAGVQVIEANLSCPNLSSGAVFNNQNLSKRILKAIKTKLKDTPLLAKIGYFPHQKELKKFVKLTNPFIDGYTAINTVPKDVFEYEGQQALPGKSRIRSGTCGALIKEAGLSVVETLAKLRKKHDYDYQIIGVGGVMTPDDYFEYLQLGADAVQSATGAMWNPYLAYQIKKAIDKNES